MDGVVVSGVGASGVGPLWPLGGADDGSDRDLCHSIPTDRLFYVGHPWTIACSCVFLMGALTWLSARRGPPPWAALVVLAVPLAVFTGAGVASDPLAFVAYVIPFVTAACLGAWRFGGATQQRIAVFAVATTAMAVVEERSRPPSDAIGALGWHATQGELRRLGTRVFSNLDIFSEGLFQPPVAATSLAARSPVRAISHSWRGYSRC